MLKFALQEFRCRKGRTLAATAGSCLALLFFILLISLLLTENRAITTVLESTGTHFIVFKPRCCDIPILKPQDQDLFVAQGNETALLERSLLEKIGSLKSVREASAFLSFRVESGVNSLIVGAFDPDKPLSVASTSCSETDVIAGRFIGKLDAKSVMVEQSFALIRNLSVGARIDLWGKSFEIAGIVNPGIRPAKADVYMTLDEAQALLGAKTGISLAGFMNIVLVESLNADANRTALVEVRSIVGNDSLVSGYGCYKPASSAMRIESTIGLIMLVCVFIFATLFQLSVTAGAVVERRREIGILAAIGWRKRRIVRLILAESVLRTTAGSLTGAVISLFFFSLFPMELLTGYVTETNLGLVVLIGLMLTMASGLVAGLAAGLSAVTQQPANCLRET